MHKLILPLLGFVFLGLTSCEQPVATGSEAITPTKDLNSEIRAAAKNTNLSRAIVGNTNSPHVKLKSIPIGDCRWTEGFWADKFEVAEKVMVPHMGSLLTGDIGHSLNNFKIAAGLKEGKHKGMFWHDGDFYKWMEAAMYVYAINRDQKILDELDEYIDIIGKAQEPDGYLQTQVTTRDNVGRYENRKFHEMYNSGHLMTSAVIHHRVTGQTNFLDIAVKHADHLVKTFSPQPKELARFGFNQTQIMGLVEMYRETGDKRYLALAEQFINARGKSKVVVDETTRYGHIGDMVQERTPLREETEAVGHAVLALYFYAGAADVYAETGEQALVDALDRLWDNVANKKMYVTGAVGQTHHGVSSHNDMVHEAFINDYMMPNATAYNETCANICNAMFSYRMLGVKGEAKHADLMELVLFNSALSGISIEGKDYFYANPLRMTNAANRDYSSTESRDREPYIECFCCPPNLVRTIAKVSGWAYSLSENGVSVNLYGGNELNTKLTDGSVLKLTQKTNYPWEGSISLTIDEAKAEAFDLMLRIPEWAAGAQVQVNGKSAGVAAEPGTFATINRAWKKGDVVTLELPMDIHLVEGHNLIEEVRNQVAVKRGPVVYCLETPDLPAGRSILDAYLPADAGLKATYKPEMLGGITEIRGDLLLRKDKKEGMYNVLEKPEFERRKTSLVPYFAWSNRGEAEMTVWLPMIWQTK
ncbi:glycoside hydrolase family 127 protein [Neolewinella aurantiaca]|uniref:Glycoside hydrolase family 127 protein n=1 Tax=Neolewinella aurantiaca TaxID=2602767 RepID=A0A5C7FNK7_9BACT|nr:glycoside hydrolase family 127 protein [Neolewinella aurantiaca]TXF87977.1 glycoside hydrolase family 127 protein [Neolewinella aurantiaca]